MRSKGFGRVYPWGGWDPRLGGYRPIPRNGEPEAPLPEQLGWNPKLGGYTPRSSPINPVPPDVDSCVFPRPDPEEDRKDRNEGE